ncbi:MAG: metallophosphoesterase [Ruminococcus sp.]|nr:metallophosphoesterase [Ruminococcus sp.]
MTKWIGILAAVFAATVGGTAYLAASVGRFGLIRRLAGESVMKRRLISLAFIGVGYLAVSIAMTKINGVIVLLHEVLFFALFGLIMRVIRAVTGHEFRIYWQGWLALTASVAYLAVGYWLCNNVWQTNYTLSAGKLSEPLTIALFADSHIGATFDGDGFAEQLEAIKAQSPDIVLIPGDFVDDWSVKEEMIKACRALGTVEAPYGVWFTFGNHDEGNFGSRDFSAYDLTEELKKNGVHVLRDEVELVDDRFYIIGRNDAMMTDRKEISQLVSGLDRDKYMIVLDHQPSDYEKEAAAGVDLVVSGHTHGGQLIPATFVGEWLGMNDRTYGCERRGSTDFIVTSGISDWNIKFKTGTKSEFVIIELQP